MKASILKLKKFFRLEAERKYDNRSVFGGLYKGLQSWVAEARAEGLGEDLILVIGARLRGYEGQTPVERQKTLLELWRRIEGETGGAQNGKTSPPQKQAAKPSPATSRPARPAVEAAGKTPVKVAATIGTEPKPGRQKAAPAPTV